MIVLLDVSEQIKYILLCLKSINKLNNNKNCLLINIKISFLVKIKMQ
jgi:hypothetical protein